MDKLTAWIRETYRPPELWLFAILVAYISIAFVALWSVGKSEHFSIIKYSAMQPSLNWPILALALLSRCAYVMIYIRPNRLFLFFAKDLSLIILSRYFIARALPTFLLITSGLGTFSAIKKSIPYFSEYIWDAQFAAIDKFIHFGEEPWRLLSIFLNTPVTTDLISIAYSLWLFVIYYALVWQIFDLRNYALRMQYLLTFAITWIVLGNVLAIIFASGGPVYYDIFVSGTSANPYADQLEYLSMVNETRQLWSVSAQEALLEKFQNNESGLGVGISAMPSMHVAMSTICALLAWRVNWVFGIVMGIYLIVILIGSVHLAWHYAIDGYVSIIVTLAIWKLVGFAIIKNSSQPGSYQ